MFRAIEELSPSAADATRRRISNWPFRVWSDVFGLVDEHGKDVGVSAERDEKRTAGGAYVLHVDPGADVYPTEVFRALWALDCRLKKARITCGPFYVGPAEGLDVLVVFPTDCFLDERGRWSQRPRVEKVCLNHRDGRQVWAFASEHAANTFYLSCGNRHGFWPWYQRHTCNQSDDIQGRRLASPVDVYITASGNGVDFEAAAVMHVSFTTESQRPDWNAPGYLVRFEPPLMSDVLIEHFRVRLAVGGVEVVQEDIPLVKDAFLWTDFERVQMLHCSCEADPKVTTIVYGFWYMMPGQEPPGQYRYDELRQWREQKQRNLRATADMASFVEWCSHSDVAISPWDTTCLDARPVPSLQLFRDRLNERLARVQMLKATAKKEPETDVAVVRPRSWWAFMRRCVVWV